MKSRDLEDQKSVVVVGDGMCKVPGRHWHWNRCFIMRYYV